MKLQKFYTENGNTAIVYNSSITVYLSPKGRLLDAKNDGEWFSSLGLEEKKITEKESRRAKKAVLDYLKDEILKSEIVWNDNTPDRWQRFEIYLKEGRLDVDYCSRFSFRYEDQNNGHNPIEYGIRYNLLYSTLKALKNIKDEKIQMAFFYNYDCNLDNDPIYDWKIIVDRKELIRIIEESLRESSK